MRKSTHDKLQSIGAAPHFVEPHESFAKTKDGASGIEVTPKHPGGNLGKFLHPTKGKPVSGVNHTVDANTAGARVRATQ